jgi:hypothetical protein
VRLRLKAPTFRFTLFSIDIREKSTVEREREREREREIFFTISDIYIRILHIRI